MIDGRRGRRRAGAAAGDAQATLGAGRAAPAVLAPGPAAPEPPGERGGVLGSLGRGARRGVEALARGGLRADHVTLAGVVLAGGTAALVATGELWPAVVLLTVGGLMDTLDGALAKAAGSASARGAFLDSVADRVADALVFGGVAWYLAAGPHPLFSLLPVGVLAAAGVVSYERAKAESLGFEARGGLMERAERLVLLGAALAFHVVLVPLLWALLGLTVLTALQRFAKVWRQATAELRGGAAEGSRWRPARVQSRWRQWREAAHVGSRPRRTGRRPRRVRDPVPLTTRLRRVLGSERARASSGGAKARREGAAVRALRRRISGER